MGTEFSLGKGVAERFDLDKGWWESIFPRNRYFNLSDLYTEPETLATDIREKVYPDNENMDNAYCLEVANRIFNWGQSTPLIFFDDETTDDYMRIPITEDRFIPRLFTKDKI